MSVLVRTHLNTRYLRNSGPPNGDKPERTTRFSPMDGVTSEDTGSLITRRAASLLVSLSPTLSLFLSLSLASGGRRCTGIARPTDYSQAKSEPLHGFTTYGQTRPLRSVKLPSSCLEADSITSLELRFGDDEIINSRTTDGKVQFILYQIKLKCKLQEDLDNTIKQYNNKFC